MLSGSVAALGCATAGAAIGVAAVAGANRVVASAAAVLLGLAYGLCLVSGLRQAEHLADPAERGAVIACYYALAHLGSVVPYLVDGLGALAGQTGAFIALTAIIAASRSGPQVMRPACSGPAGTPKLTHWSAGLAEIAIPDHDWVERRFVRTN